MIFFTDPVTGCRLRLGDGDGVRPNHPLAVAVLSLGGVGCCPTYVIPIRPSRCCLFGASSGVHVTDGVGCDLVAILAPEGVPLYPIG